jgi:hypothetical protein
MLRLKVRHVSQPRVFFFLGGAGQRAGFDAVIAALRAEKGVDADDRIAAVVLGSGEGLSLGP